MAELSTGDSATDSLFHHSNSSNIKPETSSAGGGMRSEEHTSELQSHSDLVCRLLLEKKQQADDARHSFDVFMLSLIIPSPPKSTLFPYTTLFRSRPFPSAKG